MDRSPRLLLLMEPAVVVVALLPGDAPAKQPPGCKRPGNRTEAKNAVARVFSAPREIQDDPAGRRTQLRDAALTASAIRPRGWAHARTAAGGGRRRGEARRPRRRGW